MTILLKTCCLGDRTGISPLESSSIRVSNTKWIKRDKEFKGIVIRGKSIMAWFFRQKPKLVFNYNGETLNFLLVKANVDDSEPHKNASIIQKIKVKPYADKDETGKDAAELGFVDENHIISSIITTFIMCL